MTKIMTLGMLFLGSSALASIEYGMFEKSSDGKYQSVCPVKDDGAVTCTYTYGLQQATATLGHVDVSDHQEIIKALEGIGVLALISYDEAVRNRIPASNFLLNGFYIKFDTKTILIDFAHYYTPVQISLPQTAAATISTILKTLSPIYYGHFNHLNPLVKRQNRCPVLAGKYDCQHNQLEISQLNYGVDDLYVFKYSDRPRPFDFAANDLGIPNSFDKFLAACTDQGLSIDGSIMRLDTKKNLVFLNSSTGPVECVRMTENSVHVQ